MHAKEKGMGSDLLRMRFYQDSMENKTSPESSISANLSELPNHGLKSYLFHVLEEEEVNTKGRRKPQVLQQIGQKQ